MFQSLWTIKKTTIKVVLLVVFREQNRLRVKLEISQRYPFTVHSHSNDYAMQGYKIPTFH